MNWTTPTYEDIKMDSEIGSYQEDTGPEPESPIVVPDELRRESPER